jgi:hypothetical protein
MWQSVTVTAAVCVTCSVGERVSGCDSVSKEWGRWARVGQVGTDRRAKPLGHENTCFLSFIYIYIYLYIYLFIYFLLKKARNRNRNL